jgi:hypothetical protein
VAFQQLDAARNRRLRAMELASRARHTAEPGNRDEGLQVMKIHLIIKKADVRLQDYALDGGKLPSQMRATVK